MIGHLERLARENPDIADQMGPRFIARYEREQRETTTMQPNYTLEKVKTFRGMEGQGYNATLLRDGKPVADVDDEGSGGCLNFHFYDHSSIYHAEARGEAAILRAHVATLPDVTDTGLTMDGKPFTYKPDADTFVNSLFDDHMTRRDLQSLLRRRIALVAADGSLRQYPSSIKPTPENIAKMQRSLAEPGARILNSMPFDEALAAYRSAP